MSKTKLRNSNLELYRIIAMLLIVAHHYVVNSGLTSLDGPISYNPTSAKSLFLLLFGAWGKTGINCFVLITGYFMCKSQITFKKFAKLILQVMFYNILINCVFWISSISLLLTSVSHSQTYCLMCSKVSGSIYRRCFDMKEYTMSIAFPDMLIAPRIAYKSTFPKSSSNKYFFFMS